MGLQEILWKSVDWIDLAQGNLTWWALMNTVTKLGSFNSREFLD